MFLISAILTFIATELDDFAVFVMLFAKEKKSSLQTFLGQLAAIELVTVACIFFAIPLGRIPLQYLRFIGLIPLFMGLKELSETLINRVRKNKTDKLSDRTQKREPGSPLSENKKTSYLQAFVTAFMLTIAASTDNPGIYLAWFTELELNQKALVPVIFALCQGIWSFIQMKTASIPAVEKILKKTAGILVPAVFILLGLKIIFQL